MSININTSTSSTSPSTSTKQSKSTATVVTPLINSDNAATGSSAVVDVGTDYEYNESGSGNFIVDSIDNNGYLKSTLNKIKKSCCCLNTPANNNNDNIQQQQSQSMNDDYSNSTSYYNRFLGYNSGYVKRRQVVCI